MENKRNAFYLAIFVLLLGVLSFASCKKQRKDGTDETLTLISFAENSDSFRPVDSFKDITCVQLEMTDESVLGEIKKIIDTEGNLVILTKDNEVVVFNREDGKYIRHLGSAGEGPEEYIDAQDMFYNTGNGTVDVYDRMRNDIVSYRVNGEFVGKKPLPKALAYVQSMERANDGTLLVCNQLAGGLSTDSDYAFTLICTDGKSEDFDPFAPVTVDGFAFVYAKRPMSVCGDVIKFAGFLSDTISVIDKGTIKPLYKLDTVNKFISKKDAGELDYDEFFQFCLSNNLLQGIDSMFETSQYLIFSPVMAGRYGYYWIDKKTNSGYHIYSEGVVDYEIDKVVRGRLVIGIVGYNEDELISCFDNVETYKRIFTNVISANRENMVLPESVVSAIENVDPEGNPFLLIYSH